MRVETEEHREWRLSQYPVAQDYSLTMQFCVVDEKDVIYKPQNGVMRRRCSAIRAGHPYVDGKPVRCLSTVLLPNGRCMKHGGLAPSGTEHPGTRHARYCKNLPRDLADRIETALNDPDLHSLEPDIAVAQIVVEDQLMKLGGIDGLTLLNTLPGHLDELEARLSRGDIEGAKKACKASQRITKQAKERQEGTDGLAQWLDLKRRLHTTYESVQAQKKQTVSIEEVSLLLLVTLDTAQRLVPPEFLPPLLEEFQRVWKVGTLRIQQHAMARYLMRAELLEEGVESSALLPSNELTEPIYQEAEPIVRQLVEENQLWKESRPPLNPEDPDDVDSDGIEMLDNVVYSTNSSKPDPSSSLSDTPEAKNGPEASNGHKPCDPSLVIVDGGDQ